jgi:hypothetical protein
MKPKGTYSAFDNLISTVYCWPMKIGLLLVKPTTGLALVTNSNKVTFFHGRVPKGAEQCFLATSLKGLSHEMDLAFDDTYG